MMPYSSRMTARGTLQQIVNWLRMDTKNRPGLIMAYITEPDYTGHWTAGPRITEVVSYLDRLLRKFLHTLEKDGLLCCVNLVFISDHGMGEITKYVVLDQHFNIKDLTIINGVLTHIFKGNSTLTDKEVAEALTCKGTDFVRVFTKSTMPLRLHYSKSKRIGDLVLLTKTDTLVVNSRKYIRRDKPGAHGFDYIESDMHSIMFAQGPSFKQNVVLPPFQNVEYMNLWRKLLKIPQMENDGEPAFMDLALNTHDEYLKPPQTIPNIPKCTYSLATTTMDSTCGECSAEDKISFQNWARCPVGGVSKAVVPQSESKQFCLLAGCNDMAIIKTSEAEAFTMALFEIYSNEKKDHLLGNKCTYNLIKPFTTCDRPALNKHTGGTELHFKSLSAFRGREIITPLNDYTRKVVTKFGKVVSITGTAYDDDNDGKYSLTGSKSPYPTHLYRILLRCSGKWSDKGAYCSNAEDTKVLSFVFPHMDSNVNCMNQTELLLQYTATVKQIETLTGLRFNFNNIPDVQQMILKMHINVRIW
ncbi:hypothetical protein ANCCAN_17320 [Ancylostoma caninum]|uniref:Uncharacterized protein n=1 Tax=Ancylostoma caninum TaxID=29170 RepID=A0A368FX87_ANCCA|nr:hypothetical protein ANCCAN_17320 [Ancylostoma caninum]